MEIRHGIVSCNVSFFDKISKKVNCSVNNLCSFFNLKVRINGPSFHLPTPKIIYVIIAPLNIYNPKCQFIWSPRKKTITSLSEQIYIYIYKCILVDFSPVPPHLLYHGFWRGAIIMRGGPVRNRPIKTHINKGD